MRAATPQGFPCCAVILFHACHRHYPGGIGGCMFRSLPHRCQPSPLFRRVGFRVNHFGACSTFTRVTACMIAKSLEGPSTPKASTISLPPSLLRLLPAGATVAGWDSHPLNDSAFARRTESRFSTYFEPARSPLSRKQSGVHRESLPTVHRCNHRLPRVGFFIGSEFRQFRARSFGRQGRRKDSPE